MINHDAIVDGAEDFIHNGNAGSWLVLREAVRAIGSLEHLYRLARDGRLRSRENEHNEIEVWVTDHDRLANGTAGPFPNPLLAAATAPSEPHPIESGRQIAALVASLTESHERNHQIACENGALRERVPMLERERDAYRESSAANKQALDEAQRRLESVVDANIALHMALTDTLASKSMRPGRSLWPPILVLGILIMLCMAAVAWPPVASWLHVLL